MEGPPFLPKWTFGVLGQCSRLIVFTSENILNNILSTGEKILNSINMLKKELLLLVKRQVK